MYILFYLSTPTFQCHNCRFFMQKCPKLLIVNWFFCENGDTAHSTAATWRWSIVCMRCVYSTPTSGRLNWSTSTLKTATTCRRKSDTRYTTYQHYDRCHRSTVVASLHCCSAAAAADMPASSTKLAYLSNLAAVSVVTSIIAVSLRSYIWTLTKWLHTGDQVEFNTVDFVESRLLP